jgi:S1-C subfamily serine protease
MDLDPLAALSRRTAALASQSAAHVVRVDGRRGGPASGVIWSPDGLVVTAHHVVERDEELEVGLPSGETVPAELVGRDPTTDLALLRVSASGLSAAPWTDEAPTTGELVLALSRPGVRPRASLGLVARTAAEFRAAGGGRIDRWVEVSLDVAPGLSGSLVVGAGGTPVGLASAGLVRGTILVLPPATLRRVAGALLAHGGVRRGYLGVTTLPVRLPPSAAARAGQESALLVSAVEDGSPAHRAGLLLGDALLALGGAPLAHAGDLLPLLEEERIGQALPVRLVRSGEVHEVPVTVGGRPRSTGGSQRGAGEGAGDERGGGRP